MENDKKCERHFHFIYKLNYIEHQEITVQSGANFYNGPAVESQNDHEEKEEISKPADNIVCALMPLFKNDQKEVEAFLHKIDGAKPTMITEEVNRLLKQEKITRAGCKGQMWEILHQYKIYMPSVKNWNAQVN